ncbi:MAG TPA: 2,3-bisphosphoglycerate-independent phosphoglycerate mutase, partial [Daejeonella sp.]|nr:2,3-bisphosphoglycerate-independent phosphoglycerate mutase [Daejeonella sp.]
SGLQFIQELNAHLEHSVGTIASAIGRYYAMDRDNRWERIKLAYDLMVHGSGKPSNNIPESIQQSYDDGISDEFIDPIVKTDNDGIPIGKIEPGDVVICFNFRTDRGREITSALSQQSFPEYNMQALDLYYVTMTTYDETFKNVHVVFTKDDLNQTLGAVLEQNHK